VRNATLSDEIAKVKSMHSQFDELLKQIAPRLEKNSGFAEIADNLEKYGNQMKVSDVAYILFIGSYNRLG
jgi:hypothetical protein